MDIENGDLSRLLSACVCGHVLFLAATVMPTGPDSCSLSRYMIHYTGVGSMGAPDAGAPMKFLSGIHTKSHISLNCSLLSIYCMYTWESEHPFTKSSSYAYALAGEMEKL